MYRIIAEKTSSYAADVFQMPVKRDWMDDTYDKHAYNCFPVTLTNRLGWGMSFPEDISFIWDGISDSTTDHITVLSGEKYINLGRANATISFNTNIKLITDKDLSILVLPPSNFFNKGSECFTTLISTSFFNGPIPVVHKITESNKVITIKANTPICTIIPISLGDLQNSEIVFREHQPVGDKNGDEYDNKIRKIREEIYGQGKWTNFYKEGKGWDGEKIGDHEVNSIKLKVIE